MTVVAFKNNDVENVNPLEFFYEKRVGVIAKVLKEMFRHDLAFEGLSDSFWRKHAEPYARDVLRNNVVSIPDEWKHLFECKSKKEQEKALKGITISPQLLFSIPLYAYSQGYLYSEYVYEFDPTLKPGKTPPEVAIDGAEELKIYGRTNMTKGEVRASIQQTKYCYARIMAKKEEWICLFSTRRGIMGAEPGELGKQPHLHFISDKYGLTKEIFLSKFKAGKVGSSTHIPLKGYKASEDV